MTIKRIQKEQLRITIQVKLVFDIRSGNYYKAKYLPAKDQYEWVVISKKEAITMVESGWILVSYIDFFHAVDCANKES